MKQLNELATALEDAKARVQSVRNLMTVYLMPILRAATGRPLDANPQVRGAYPDDNTVGIDVFYNPSRGEPWSDHYTLPRAILEADDPIEAARAMKAAADQRKRAQLAKLQAELAEHPPAKPTITYSELTFDEAVGYPDRGTVQQQCEYMTAIAERRAGKAAK